MARPRSIRTAFVVLGGALAVIALVLSAGLGLSGALIVRISEDYARTVAGLRAVEEIQVDLLLATRSHQLYGETGDPQWLDDMRAAEDELVRLLDDAVLLVDSEEERVLLAQLSVMVDEIRREVLAASPSVRTITRAEVVAALQTAQALVDVNDRSREAALARVDDWSRLALAGSLSGVGLTVATLAAAVLYARRSLYLPVARLSEAIESRRHDPEVRVPDEGPVELREIAGRINQLIDRLAAQREQQLTFLASVAHDLRGPMTSLQLTAHLTLRQEEIPPETVRERAQVLLTQVKRMRRLVNDLLDVSRIEAGRFDLHVTPQDLRAVVRETAELYTATSERHPIRCEVPDDEVVVPHDRTRLAQVLSNLVSNAIKYSPEGGPVDLRLRREGERVVIEVQDTGIGIPPDEQGRVFEPFRRSGGGTDGIPGVGLGLSVARRLVRAHGGDIELESAPGEGSTFRVVLPGEAPAA